MTTSPRPKTLSLHQEITFGLDGNDAPFLGDGWGGAELGRRALGSAGELRMIHPGDAGMLLELEAAPPASAALARRIDIDMNGVPAATIDMVGQERRAAFIPAGRVPGGQILTLRLRPPGPGAGLSRLRLFTLRVATADRPDAMPGTAAAALARFQSIGDTDEFGLIQQLSGVAGPGLLHVAANLPSLLRAIDAGFAGLGEPGSFDVTLHPRDACEYVVADSIFGAELRGFHGEAEIRLAAFIDRQGARLRELRGDLVRGVAGGEKIFVAYRSLGPALTEQEVLPLLIALNRHAPNHLLWVTPADAARSPGTVTQGVPYLLHGAIDRFMAGRDPKTASHEVWLQLCTTALRIATAPGPAPPPSTISSAQPAALPILKPEGPPAPLTPTPIAPAPLHPGQPTPAMPAFRAAPADRPAAVTAAASQADAYALLQSWGFGETGNEEAVLGPGWSVPEDGFRWTDGNFCELWLDHPGKRDIFVVVEAWPLTVPPGLPAQRAVFSAHDTALGALTFTDRARLALPVAAAGLRPGRVLRLRVDLPDAARPVDIDSSEDERQLAIGFMRVSLHAASGRHEQVLPGTGGISTKQAQARTGLAPQDLLARFESLGESQVLADLQAMFGAEAQGLFQRASLRLFDLAVALDGRFEGLGDPARLTCELIGRDPELYEIRDETVGLGFVAERLPGDASPAMLVGRQARRLKFLRDQLLHDLSAGEKIFVFHRPLDDTALTEPEMLALLISLRQHGPCTLLYLVRADRTHPPGTVAQLYPGLLRGNLGEVEPADGPNNESAALWLEVCANALTMKAAG